MTENTNNQKNAGEKNDHSEKTPDQTSDETENPESWLKKPSPGSRRPEEPILGVNQRQVSEDSDNNKQDQSRSGTGSYETAKQAAGEEEAGNQTPGPQDTPGADAEIPSRPSSASDDERVRELETQLGEMKDRYVRAMAEIENVRKRSAKERQDVSKYAVSSFARDLLGFSDNFRRALESLPEDMAEQDERIQNTIGGIQAMERELLKIFEKHGIHKIEPLDEAFDPNYHEVMFEIPDSGKPAGTIVQLLEPGFMLNDRLLRPARVGIAKADDNSDSSAQGGGQNIDEQF